MFLDFFPCCLKMAAFSLLHPPPFSWLGNVSCGYSKCHAFLSHVMNTQFMVNKHWVTDTSLSLIYLKFQVKYIFSNVFRKGIAELHSVSILNILMKFCTVLYTYSTLHQCAFELETYKFSIFTSACECVTQGRAYYLTHTQQ